MGLVDLTRDFLTASNYDVDSKEHNLLVASRPGLGGDKEYRCVWVLTDEERKGKQQLFLEDEYLVRFRGVQKSPKYRGAGLYLLANSLEGLSADFLSRARRQIGVKVHVPSQFFDTDFKYESISRATASAILDLANTARDDSQRVPQAYTQEDGAHGDDLLQHLLTEIDAAQDSQEATVWFVAAPAGYGKSVLFSPYSESYIVDFRTARNANAFIPDQCRCCPRTSGKPPAITSTDSSMHFSTPKLHSPRREVYLIGLSITDMPCGCSTVLTK